MDLVLHFRSVNPLIKNRLGRIESYNLLQSKIVDDPIPRFRECLSRTASSGNRCIRLSSSSIGRRKKGFVYCKKLEDGQTSKNPSKFKQEEIVSLLGRIQTSISKERESRGVEAENNRDGSYEDKTLSKAILDVLEKPRAKIEGHTEVKEETPKRQVKVARPPSSFAKGSHMISHSSPKAKPPVSKSAKALEVTEKEEEKPPLIETIKLAELKEVAKKRGIKGYSKLKKSELLKLIRSS